MFVESQVELLLFLKERGHCMGQALGTELGNNTFSNSLGLGDPINSSDVFFSHI